MEDFKKLVKDNSDKKFLVTFNNGDTKELRLFYHYPSDSVCYYPPRKKKYGNYLYGYTKIELIPQNDDKVKKARRFLKKLIVTLSASGLWSDLLENAIIINKLSDSDLLLYLEDEWENAEKLGIKRFGTDTLAATIKKGFKKINYNDYSGTKTQFNAALNSKTNFSEFWRKGYDNRISCRFDCSDGIKRAWYSEEYKNCANGHYYLVVDGEHAIFCEDD